MPLMCQSEAPQCDIFQHRRINAIPPSRIVSLGLPPRCRVSAVTHATPCADAPSIKEGCPHVRTPRFFHLPSERPGTPSSTSLILTCAGRAIRPPKKRPCRPHHPCERPSMHDRRRVTKNRSDTESDLPNIWWGTHYLIRTYSPR